MIKNIFQDKYARKEKISVLTCYDFSFARILSNSEIDCILVGDSLGMVVQGRENTLPVTLEEMIYHTSIVKRGAGKKPVVFDLPFFSYQQSIEDGLKSAGRAMKESQCDAVKLEGASETALKQITICAESGIPVMGHLGLTPQSYMNLGGFKIQGKSEKDAEKIISDAKKLEEAGVFSIVLEMIPESLGKIITESLSIPTIGIGAGRFTSGQVLVLYDMLGMNPDFNPKFLKKYKNLGTEISNAVNEYCRDIKVEKFPGEENIF